MSFPAKFSKLFPFLQQQQQLPYPESVPEFVPSSPQQHQQQTAVAPAAPSPAAPAIPMVKIFDANVNQLQWAPIGTVCHTFRMEGRFWDLEQLLSTSGMGSLVMFV